MPEGKHISIGENFMKLNTNFVMAQPDPFMCPVENGWVMYVTGGEGVGAYFAQSPFGPWEYRGIVYAQPGKHEYWAPCMYYENGWYYLYVSYRAMGAADCDEFLYVARAQNPFGPFRDEKQLADCFSIDPHVVRTDAGLFLWYCMDRTDCQRAGTRIFVQKMQDPQCSIDNLTAYTKRSKELLDICRKKLTAADEQLKQILADIQQPGQA